MNSMLQMLIGEFPWSEDAEDPYRLLFLIFFILIFFYLLTNMFLAIVLDAFEKAKTTWQNADEDQGLFTDVKCVMYWRLLQHWYDWPTHYDMIKLLKAPSDPTTGDNPKPPPKKDDEDDEDTGNAKERFTVDTLAKAFTKMNKPRYTIQQLFQFYYDYLPML